ncbi:hypothetical protein GCM10017687_26190 [Streptomyces echinatus]
MGTADTNCRAGRLSRTRPKWVVSGTRGIQQYHRVTEGKERDAIRIARARKQSARVPQAPDWKVVPGHASAIPAVPPSQADPADVQGRRSSPVDGVESSGPGCQYGARAPRRVPRKKRSMPPGSFRAVTPLDDDDFPAYTMGRAADMLGTTPAFLRALGEHRLITPLRSEGGHRRYSRYQLRIAARARELVDQGTPIEAACRIIVLEDQLEEAQRINEQMRTQGPEPQSKTSA